MPGFNFSRCYIIVLIYLFFSNHLFAQQSNKIHYKVLKFHSNILNEERTLNLYLPDNYKSTKAKYPVLYQLDGEEKNFLNAVQTLWDLSSPGEKPEMIVVGIKNTDRWRDMLPVKQKKHPTSGGAHNFSKFLHLELVPYIDKNYRTNHVRILSGQSNSALFTLFVLIEDKNVFTGYIASSPSLGHCKDYMFNKITSFLRYHSKLNKFLL